MRMTATLGYNLWRSGDAWFICDRCGQRHRRSRMLTEWDSLRVDAKCLDPRPPQMDPPDVYPEGLPFPDARTPQDNPDRLMDDSFLQAVGGGIVATTGLLPINANGQSNQPGAISPQQVIVDPIPANTPLHAIVADNITLRTGLVYAKDVQSPPDPSPGPVPPGLPNPPFTDP